MGANVDDTVYFHSCLCSLGDIDMGTVLKRLKIEGLTKKFQTEHNITPDIVCKLLVHKMEMLGMSSRSDMISLQVECTKFGEVAPKKLTRG